MSVRLLLVSADTAVADTVRAALDSAASLMTIDQLGDRPRAGFEPSVVVIDSDVRSGVQTAFEKIEAARRMFPVVPIIVLGNEMSAQLVLVALRAGADEFVDRAADAEHLRLVIGERLATSQDTPLAARAKIAAVLSCLPCDQDQDFALNLAVRAAKRTPGEMTLYVDLSVPVSQAGICLGVDASFGVPDAVREVARIDRALLESALARHAESGLYVMPYCADPNAEVPALDSADFGALLQVLRGICGAIVVGYGPFSRERALLDVVQPNARLFLCCNQRFSSIRRAGEILEWLGKSGLGLPEVVVHALTPSLTPTASDVARALKIANTIDLDASWDELAESLNTAKPLALTRSPYTRGLDACLARLGFGEEPEPHLLAQLRGLLNLKSAMGTA
jgi:Flp pilus assembly CpaE family ATPase